MPDSTTVFVNGTAVLPDRLLPQAAVVCRGGRIAAVAAEASLQWPDDAAVIDAQGGYISPGFVDQHVHGGGGADFMDAQPQAVRTAIAAHTRHGTTSIFPTTTTGTPAQIRAMLDACAAVAADWKPSDGARLAGVHLYGPYFAHDKIGAHPRGLERDPDPTEYLPILDEGLVRVATCAAELPGAQAFYRAAADRGCLVTCGHSNASWTEMQRAFDAGMRHVDHFWSAMSSVPSIRQRLGTPMQGSMEQFVLFHKEMSTEVIADGQHLSPELLEFAFRMKGPDRLCLVTDSARCLDSPPGDYHIGSKTNGTLFHYDGQMARALDTGNIASSTRGMDHMVRHMACVTSAPLHEVVRMASLTPAHRIGLSKDRGSLDAGKLADLVLLSRDLHVRGVYISGVQAAGQTAPAAHAPMA